MKHICIYKICIYIYEDIVQQITKVILELPTPVSALLHAATMVCAGVYVLARSWFILEYAPSILLAITILGGITTLVSGLIAVAVNDIKKVIALSTMSQSKLARKYICKYIFRNLAICVELLLGILLLKANELIISKVKYTLNKLYFSYNSNSQITKAHIYNHYYGYEYISNALYTSFFAMRQYWQFVIVMSEQWKVITISKLVDISETIRQIFILINIYLIYFVFSQLVFNHNDDILYFPQLSSYLLTNNNNTINSNNYNYNNYINKKLENNSNKETRNLSDIGFNEWLSGVIDGDGYFNLSKGGTARLIIVMDIRDKGALYAIKHKFGGSIYTIAKANALKYKISHKKGLINLINAVNGNIRNPIRLLQMNKLCVKYNLEIKEPKPLKFNNGWLSGLLDADGSIYLNDNNKQIFISISQKNKYLLEKLQLVYSGRIYISSPKTEAFRYQIYRKNELFNLIDNYFTKYPLRTLKMNRINLIKEFFIIINNNNNINNIEKFNPHWLKFKERWDKYLK